MGNSCAENKGKRCSRYAANQEKARSFASPALRLVPFAVWKGDELSSYLAALIDASALLAKKENKPLAIDRPDLLGT
jgi:hypothetical protein